MTVRKKLFLSAALFGLFSGALVFFVSIAPQHEGFERVAKASRMIRKDEFLRQEMFRIESVDSKRLPANAIREADIVNYGGHISVRDISAGEILRTVDFKR